MLVMAASLFLGLDRGVPMPFWASSRLQQSMLRLTPVMINPPAQEPALIAADPLVVT
jgi:hypothetical protein